MANGFWEQSYQQAKQNLEEILTDQDQFVKTCNTVNPSTSYTCPLRALGFSIIEYVEQYKANTFLGKSLATADLTEVFNILSDFIRQNRNAENIDGIIEALKTKIKTEEGHKFASKICAAIGLGLILTGISLMAFCVATGNASLLPLAVCGLAFLGPIMMAFAFGLNQNHHDRRIKDYFFNATTPGSADARKSLLVFEAVQLSMSRKSL